jgi:hypothetical protein
LRLLKSVDVDDIAGQLALLSKAIVRGWRHFAFQLGHVRRWQPIGHPLLPNEGARAQSALFKSRTQLDLPQQTLDTVLVGPSPFVWCSHFPPDDLAYS